MGYNNQPQIINDPQRREAREKRSSFILLYSRDELTLARYSFSTFLVIMA
jgi:hypothetical protein